MSKSKELRLLEIEREAAMRRWLVFGVTTAGLIVGPLVTILGLLTLNQFRLIAGLVILLISIVLGSFCHLLIQEMRDLDIQAVELDTTQAPSKRA